MKAQSLLLTVYLQYLIATLQKLGLHPYGSVIYSFNKNLLSTCRQWQGLIKNIVNKYVT